jgi:hypothetical protein
VQVAKALPRIVENPADRLPVDSPMAISLARVWSKGEKGYFQLITENNDTPKQVTDIIKGVTNIVLKVQAVLNDMEGKYKKIWDTDKEAYMRRYRKNLESRDFDADIKLYLDHIDEIRAEESTINLEFLYIDQQPIKAVRTVPYNVSIGVTVKMCASTDGSAEPISTSRMACQPIAVCLLSGTVKHVLRTVAMGGYACYVCRYLVCVSGAGVPL